MYVLGFWSREQRRTREVVATLALALCKLRGLPPLSDRDLDMLLKTPVMWEIAKAPVPGADGLEELIGQLDRLIMARRCP